MKRSRYLLFVLLAAWFVVCAMAASADPGLRHDPFVRPNIEPTPPAAAAPGATAASEWKPQLRAVMVAGSSSMVNVDGTIVRVGGQIDGFRLTRVAEHKAVFVKNGVRVELTTDGERSVDR